jgi:hypothetical protein
MLALRLVGVLYTAVMLGWPPELTDTEEGAL